jgi:two-component system, NtrC family, response regulator GlrR
MTDDTLAQPQSHTILVVDDDADIVKLIAMRLTAAGYKTLTAHHAKEAIQQVQLRCPDLVVSDLRMPDMSGLALMEHLHVQHPTLPVILLTAHGSINEAVDATQRGAFSFLTKPFNGQELLQIVANALRLSGASNANLTAENSEWRTNILTRSPKMESLLGQAKLISRSDVSVLIQGESGTGKELLAQGLHKQSARRHKPFIAINCGAIPENLLESELFGHSKGAFTGAVSNHIGLFQSAEGGTLFLDEIGDMPTNLQVKVLRALQERVIRPVGSNTQIPIDIRLISATHKNLLIEMQENRFREDLFYRINVVSLELPTLTERREDISLLANHFLTKFNEKYNKTISGFSVDAMDSLIQANWPGNIRQLQNAVEQTVVLCTTKLIPHNLVQKALQTSSTQTIKPLEEARMQFEQAYLINLLKTTQGNVALAAKIAQRNRTEFYRLLSKHNIQASVFKESLK